MASSTSTYALSEPASDDLRDYDVISAGQQSIDSSIADLGSPPASTPREPAPTPEAARAYDTVRFTAEEIQAHVRAALERAGQRAPADAARPVRVYVDGVFDVLHAGHTLQLRQAKLSFPAVHLLAGAHGDAVCSARAPCAERAELLRAVRWVDEVIAGAPAQPDVPFLAAHAIDFVAVEEGALGYELVRSLGKVIPTRLTRGLVGPALVAGPTTPERPSMPLVEDDDSVPPEPIDLMS